MRAVVCHEFTGPAALRLEDIPEPRPGTGQVRILVEACGVNFADSLISRGQYQKQPQPPFSPGFEVSGEILELGVGVEELLSLIHIYAGEGVTVTAHAVATTRSSYTAG